MPVLFSYALDPETPNPSLSGDEITTMLRDDRLAWVHLDMTAHGVEDWLNENMDYLGAPVLNALLAAETRPRVTFQPNGVLLILRGINLNQGAEPEDMVSIRLWVDEHRIVSLQRRNLRAVTALVDQIKAQQGPKTSAEFLDRLLGALLLLLHLDGHLDIQLLKPSIQQSLFLYVLHIWNELVWSLLMVYNHADFH
jgi:zinc transporter